MFREPTVVLGAIAEVIKAVIPTLIIFGVIQWTGDQVAQVMLLVSVVIGALTVILTRAQVTPESTVNALIREAVDSPVGTKVSTVKAAVEKKESE